MSSADVLLSCCCYAVFVVVFVFLLLFLGGVVVSFSFVKSIFSKILSGILSKCLTVWFQTRSAFGRA